MDQEISFGKKDIIAGLIIGAMVAILATIAMLIGIISKIPLWWSLIVVMPVLCLAGLYAAFLIGKKIRVVYQFAKFFLVGGLNTLIDFEVLNILMRQTGIAKGEFIILFNAISFTIAITNSYLWNRFWTFKEARDVQVRKESVGKEFVQFLIVSLIGMGLNSGIVYATATYMKPLFGLGQVLWTNFAKALATGASLIWNFIGYKFIVFNVNKTKDTEAQNLPTQSV